ncbi:MAG: nitronate monooxygenase [Anaerolineae bacterium]
MTYPTIIQGGMGVAVSSWRLANAVSQQGQLGVVSGTGIGLMLISRLMSGDVGGHVRRALSAFPYPDIAQSFVDQYYIEGGKPVSEAFVRPPLWTINPSQELNQLTVIANFVEIWLAKEGHNNPVGINLLEKVQLPNLASLYGAMLAGVDYVIMGAGIPMHIPGVLDRFVDHQPTSYRLDVAGTEPDDDYRIHFDPQAVFPDPLNTIGRLQRPLFLPIVSSVVLAMALLKRANGAVDGFVIEMPTAGGHNAPPRVEAYNERGEPVYGKKDEVDLSKFRKFGLPFWLAGGYGNPQMLQQALAEGATGVQVGTAFAYTDESGFDPALKQQVIDLVLADDVTIYTDPVASPTGFPFKVVQVPGTVSDDAVYQARPRVCDVGYLRHMVKREGEVIYRCPAEPIKAYLNKGGKLEDTVGRKCLCNQLGAAAGHPQVKRSGFVEPAIVTSGDDLPQIKQFIPAGQNYYNASDVVTILLGVQQPV